MRKILTVLSLVGISFAGIFGAFGNIIGDSLEMDGGTYGQVDSLARQATLSLPTLKPSTQRSTKTSYWIDSYVEILGSELDQARIRSASILCQQDRMIQIQSFDQSVASLGSKNAILLSAFGAQAEILLGRKTLRWLIPEVSLNASQALSPKTICSGAHRKAIKVLEVNQLVNAKGIYDFDFNSATRQLVVQWRDDFFAPLSERLTRAMFEVPSKIRGPAEELKEN